MRRTSILLFSLSLLSACGGSDSVIAVCTQDYWDGTMGLCLPDKWVVVDRETLRQRGVPEDTIVAFQAEEAVSGQFPTVAVTREELATPVDASTYSEASIRSVTALPGYELVDTRAYTIDGTEVNLHIFTAQPIPEEPKRRFYQVSTISNGAGFTVTGTTPVSITDSLRGQIESIMGAVTFVAPEGEEAAE